MNRRSFFQRCAAFAATIALAPELVYSKLVNDDSVVNITIPKVDDQYQCVMRTPDHTTVLHSQVPPFWFEASRSVYVDEYGMLQSVSSDCIDPEYKKIRELLFKEHPHFK